MEITATAQDASRSQGRQEAASDMALCAPLQLSSTKEFYELVLADALNPLAMAYAEGWLEAYRGAHPDLLGRTAR